jgi:hypothetical protein
MRPRRPIGRQQAGIRGDLGEIFSNRQRVPDRYAVMAQPRHQHRGRQQQQLLARAEIVDGDALLLEIEPGHVAEQPAAQ